MTPPLHKVIANILGQANVAFLLRNFGLGGKHYQYDQHDIPVVTRNVY
ncbi:MAG: hypothetical protein ACLPXB_16480 [Thiobacillaceae bacterium]